MMAHHFPFTATTLHLMLLAVVLCIATAFSSRASSIRALGAPFDTHKYPQRQSYSQRTRVIVKNGNFNNDNGKGDGNLNKENPLDGMELTSALARIDQQWQIQQQRSPEKSRWTKLVLPKEENSDDSTENIMEDPPLKNNMPQSEEDVVYLLEPNKLGSSPSCLIVFVGGAGLGQFPNIAYSDFLKRLSDKLNAAILTAPYAVGLDHFELAKQTGDKLRRAILYCQDDPKRQYPESLPCFALSHSLGCKLQTIYVAATSQDYRGMGFISYNNFGFGQTIQMAKSFASQLRGTFGGSSGIVDQSEDALNMIFGMAETVFGAVGLDFSPNSKDTERLIQSQIQL